MTDHHIFAFDFSEMFFIEVKFLELRPMQTTLVEASVRFNFH